MSVNPARPPRLGARLLGIALLAFAAGCSTLEPKAVIAPLGSEPDHHVITKTASLATTLVVPRNTKYFLCASPPPDALFTQAENVGLSISMLNFGRGTDDSVEESSAEEEMAGRTPAVVLARELLYRFCEFQLNQQLTRDQAIELYRQNLSIIREIAIQEASNTRVTIGESQTVSTVQAPAKASAPPQRASAVPAPQPSTVAPAPEVPAPPAPQSTQDIPQEVVTPQ
jgi:hypothetical protein